MLTLSSHWTVIKDTGQAHPSFVTVNSQHLADIKDVDTDDYAEDIKGAAGQLFFGGVDTVSWKDLSRLSYQN